MRKIYGAIAWTIAAGVVVQAAAIALGFGSVLHRVEQGGVIDKVALEDPDPSMTGSIGFAIHLVVGSYVLHGLALLLLVVAFFAKVPHGIRWAAAVFVLVFVQGSLGFSIRDLPYAGAVHGANALALLVVAVLCARRAAEPPTEATGSPVLQDAHGPGRG